MKKFTALQLIGIALGFSALALAWIWFSWKLAIILFLVFQYCYSIKKQVYNKGNVLALGR